MKLFDSHCHIDDKVYENDIIEVINRAAQEQVKGIMIVGVDLSTSHRAIEIARDNPCIITSVGIHPHDASNCSTKTLETLKNLAKEHTCIKAWGETGLDFNRMFSPQKDQETCFSSQLNLAGDLDLPLIFHERDSNGRFYEILKSEGPATRKGVVHCFSGTKAEMFKYLDLGYHIGITGILTLQKRGEYLRTIAPLIPDDKILIETDAPYLTPAPQKNKFRRNEPAFVKSVLLKLAQIKQTDPDQLSRTIFENTLKFYNLPTQG
ncbi:MAG: TatD family hydrolase [Desulfobacteraceae bacterium]|nr:TatD family hydrolase [Desulfobacteraceae bacterium]